MKKNILLGLAFFAVMVAIFSFTRERIVSDKVKDEITETLKRWNTAAKEANADKFVLLFDNSENVMMIGSDSGEVYKGRDEIKRWASNLFATVGSFSWDMAKINIDDNDNTAWVFMEGSLIVSTKSGSTVKSPYRFTGIMVKKDNEWKWRLYNGSIPQAEKK